MIDGLDPNDLAQCLRVLALAEQLPPEHPDAVAVRRATARIFKAVKKVGTTDPDKVIAGIIGIKVPNLTGGVSDMLPNHHITKPVLTGETGTHGQLHVVSDTP